jgi:hypothetical protein
MQPLFCSTASPWGIHLSIRDNMCARCGWIAPRYLRLPSVEDNGSMGSVPQQAEDGGRA